MELENLSQPTKSEPVSISIDEEERANGVESLSARPQPHRWHSTIRNCLWIFPLIASLGIPLTCITVYSLSVYYGHVEPVFPYVSDSGGTSPEGNHFSQMLDIIAICVAISALIRYKQCIYIFNQKVSQKKSVTSGEIAAWNEYNYVTSLIAYLMAFFVSMIGNYRSTDVIILHFSAAFFTSILAGIYGHRQIRTIEYLAKFQLESRPISIRVILWISFVSLLGCLVFSTIGAIQFGGQWYTFLYEHQLRLKWTPEMAGHTFHAIGTALEWVAINSAGLLFFSVFRRFRSFQEWDKVSF